MVAGRDKRVQLVRFPARPKPRVLSIGGDHISHGAFSDDGTTLLASTDRWIKKERENGILIEGSTNFVDQLDASTGASRFQAQPTDTDAITLSFGNEKGPNVKAGRAQPTLADLAASRATVLLPGSKESSQVR